ncbi:EAL domain-containing protein [Aestuariibacter halophilus]|uniref:EAL domain-containing protein n=1 Tax=Fluctibacter halophilus TaxID=226011 RepID=A0ABS8G9H3_9ALTE|nr:EAL domain-containing protein [Aestuariibacter halophilus]MCC2617168.1 EAL domain-containing protein [Aestuariibacter halophilus]
MFAFIARQPILDGEKEVYAYELLFRDGVANCYPDHADDDKAERMARETLKLGLDDISCQKTAFINFQRDTLLKGLPATLDPQTVVVEIEEPGTTNHGLLEACKQIKNMGFQLAIDDPMLEQDAHGLLPLVDIVKVDVGQHKHQHIAQKIPGLLNANVKLVAEEVETQQQFLTYKNLGFDYFQGYFFSKPESLAGGQLPTSKLALVQLISEASSRSFNIDSINEIIERDVGLSYMLLRFINNPLINKRYKITSLRHALTYMGEVEIKKFIALLALANLTDDKPMELIHMSLVRARFCDSLAKEKAFGDNPPTGFMVGLFSLLDALLDQPMKELVEKMPIVDEVKFALCGGQNDFALFLLLARAFESATWLKVKRVSDALQLDQKRVHGLFNEAVLWGNSVRQTISPHFPKPHVQ